MGLITLNQNAIVEDRNTIMDIALARFYASRYSQSNVFLGAVQSLGYIVMLSGRDGGIDKVILGDHIKNATEVLLKPYFDSTNCIVSTLESTINPGTIDIEVMFTGTYLGKTYSIDKVWEVNDSKLKKISNLL